MVKDPLFSRGEWLTRLTPFSMVKPYLAELLLISFMINLLSLALPLTLLQVYDRILRFSAMSTLEWLLAGVFVALLLESLLRLGRSYLSSWVGAKFEHWASCAAMEQLLTVPLTLFEQSGAGVHWERMNAINTLKEFYSGQAALVLFEMPFVIVFLLLIDHLAGILVVVPLILFALFLLFAWYFQVRLYRHIQESGATDDKRMDFIIETLNGIHLVKALSMEAMMARRYERLLAESACKIREIGLQGADSQNIGQFFAQLATISVVTFGGIMVIHQQLTVGGLVACSMLSGRALQPLQMAVGIWARFQSIRFAREQLKVLFSQRAEGFNESCDEEPEPGMVEVQGGIELQNVIFHGRGTTADSLPLLNGISLQVAPGETVGIIGANGSGKSVLLELMMGLLSPSEGRVLLDGCNPVLKRLPAVAYLPQEGELFRGTVLENMHMFREENSQAALAFAKRLGLDPFFSSLPKGYDTVVDEGSADTIPRGVRQQIAIVRALATHPRLVLFDEANTAIDGHGDGKLRQVLEGLRGKSTLIVVSHRPSLLRLADRVFELRDGQLVPLTTHPSAMAGA